MVDTSENKISDVLSRGVVDVIQKDELAKKLKSGKQLRVKLGIDPSGADLHIGHMVVIKKLKEFQDLGHKIILLFGNFTGQIGDPTGKMETRQAKTQEQLEKNAEKYLDQVSKLLDTDKVEVRRNAEWLSELNFADVINLSSCFTVAQMMERDMFQERESKNLPISMHEFLYPLMQGYDSVALKADIELGGTDQTFNLLAGRTIQKAYSQPPQDILTVPILEGTDGVVKMGKSENNYIAVDDEPNEMYGKVMSIPDKLIVKYFELATNVPTGELEEINKMLGAGENPMNLKKRLAREIIEIYHSKEAGESAEANFTKVFSEHKLPDDMPEKKAQQAQMNIVDLLMWTELVPSKSQARRLVEQGAVKIDDKKVESVDSEIDLSGEKVLQVGKRRFIKVVG
jgi:tyrosyl-tRNA synthetase